MIAMLTSPVFAANPNKVDATAKDLVTTGYKYDPLTYRWTTDGNITHIDYMEIYGTLNLYIDGEIIAVTWVDIVSGTYNSKTLQGIVTFEEIWTLEGGTFVGTAHITYEGGTLITYKEFYSHIILHGTGDYEGQMLSLDMDRPDRAQPAIYEGFWLKA